MPDVCLSDSVSAPSQSFSSFLLMRSSVPRLSSMVGLSMFIEHMKVPRPPTKQH